MRYLRDHFGNIRPAYIVAGGPSLRGFDWSRLWGKFHLAINRAYEVCPSADIVYWTDDGFWKHHRDRVLQHPGKLVRGLARKPKKGEDEDGRVRIWKFSGCPGLETRPGQIRHGTNSTHAAINLLSAHLGFKRIYLLGVDMKFSGDHTHWHCGYPTSASERVYANMAKNIRTLVDPLKEIGCEVYNANPDSALECFHKVSIDAALRDDPSMGT